MSGSRQDKWNAVLQFLLCDSAPGMRDQVAAYMKRHGTKLEIDHAENHILFGAHAKSQTILMGLRCVPRLWALVCGSLSHYESIRKQRASDPSSREAEIDPDEWPIRLLNWSVLGEINSALADRREATLFNPAQTLNLYPDGVPPLLSTGPSGSLLDHTKIIFGKALGFVLHHEFTHVREGHEAGEGEAAIQEERVADQEAARWMLHGLGDDSQAFIVNSIGIALGLLWLLCPDVFLGSMPSTTHPPRYERVFDVLDRHVLNPSHPAWAFTAVILSFLVESSGKDVTAAPAGTAKDHAGFYLRLVAGGGG